MKKFIFTNKNTKPSKLKFIIPTTIIAFLTIACIIIGDVFSDNLLSPGRSTFEDKFKIYNENPNYDGEYYLNAEKVPFDVTSTHGYNISGEYLPNPNQTTTKNIYFIHGYGVNRAQALWFVETYHALGFNVVIYDQVGSGESGGDYATMGVNEADDLQAVRLFTEETYGTPEKTALHGISLGASTAMYYNEVYGDISPVDYILADCGYSNMKDEVIYQYQEQFDLPNFPFVNLANIGLQLKAGYTLKDVNCLKSVASDNYKNTKLLIIHGGNDTFTPTQMAYDLDAAAKYDHKLEIFDGVGHAKSYETDPERYTTLMTELFQ